MPREEAGERERASAEKQEDEKVGGDESENERWMLARDRSGHVRQHPFPSFFPVPVLRRHPPFFLVPLARAHTIPFLLRTPFFLPPVARLLARDADIRPFFRSPASSRARALIRS